MQITITGGTGSLSQYLQMELKGKLEVATKGGHPEFEWPSTPRVNPKDIVSDLDASLELFGLDTIDLYWLHRDNPTQPVGPIVETLNEQLRFPRGGS